MVLEDLSGHAPSARHLDVSLPEPATFEFVFAEEGANHAAGTENTAPIRKLSPWDVEVSESNAGTRALRWIKRLGSPPEPLTHRVALTDVGVMGNALHHELHGAGTENLTPAPLLVPGDLSPGEFSGSATGSRKEFMGHAVDYEYEYDWRLTLRGTRAVVWRGRTWEAVILQRDVTELVKSREQGDTRWVQSTEELFVPELGILVLVQGREQEVGRPDIVYDVQFSLRLKDLET